MPTQQVHFCNLRCCFTLTFKCIVIEYAAYIQHLLRCKTKCNEHFNMIFLSVSLQHDSTLYYDKSDLVAISCMKCTKSCRNMVLSQYLYSARTFSITISITFHLQVHVSSHISNLYLSL